MGFDAEMKVGEKLRIFEQCAAPCFPPMLRNTGMGDPRSNVRGTQGQLYGQFAFNSVPKEPPITRLLAYLSH